MLPKNVVQINDYTMKKSFRMTFNQPRFRSVVFELSIINLDKTFLKFSDIIFFHLPCCALTVRLMQSLMFTLWQKAHFLMKQHEDAFSCNITSSVSVFMHD